MSGAGEFGSEILGPEEHMRCMDEKRQHKAKLEITKPCPFCGTPARVEDGEHEENMGTGCDLMPRVVGDWRGVFIVYCKMCGARGPECAGGTEDAIREWNDAKWTQWSKESPLHERNRMTALECALALIRRECEHEDQEHMIGGRVRDLVDSVLRVKPEQGIPGWSMPLGEE